MQEKDRKRAEEEAEGHSAQVPHQPPETPQEPSSSLPEEHQIHCPNASEGCDWVGESGQLSQHLQTCPYGIYNIRK